MWRPRKELTLLRVVGRPILAADPLSSGSSRLKSRLRAGLPAPRRVHSWPSSALLSFQFSAERCFPVGDVGFVAFRVDEGVGTTARLDSFVLRFEPVIVAVRSQEDVTGNRLQD